MRSLLACFIIPFVSVVALPEEPKEITNSIGMNLVLVPKGAFTMGSPAIEENRHGADEHLHGVIISKSFYLGAYEVTQSQYSKIIGKNPSYFQGDNVAERGDRRFNEPELKQIDSSNHPVERVKWHEAVEFCRLLSELPEEKKAGRVYRLPTEAEWEYACRAGTGTHYNFGNDPLLIREHAWFVKNSDTRTHAIGQKLPNNIGLYDMHGNVSEWCADWFDESSKFTLKDPVGPRNGEYRVVRGGHYQSQPADLRSAFRTVGKPDEYSQIIGFRVALTSSVNSKKKR